MYRSSHTTAIFNVLIIMSKPELYQVGAICGSLALGPRPDHGESLLLFAVLGVVHVALPPVHCGIFKRGLRRRWCGKGIGEGIFRRAAHESGGGGKPPPPAAHARGLDRPEATAAATAAAIAARCASSSSWAFSSCCVATSSQSSSSSPGLAPSLRASEGGCWVSANKLPAPSSFSTCCCSSSCFCFSVNALVHRLHHPQLLPHV